MSLSLKIPESYKDITTVTIKGIENFSDVVICTTDKKLLTFFNGYLLKSCQIDIIVTHLEPIIVYKPKIEVYYILYGENKVVIVKEETSLEVIKTYSNVYEIVVNDHNNSGIPQLFMNTDKGFECVEIFESEEIDDCQTNLSVHQETSVVHTFCINKLQKLKLLYDSEKNKLSQKATSFINAVTKVSDNGSFDVEFSSSIITKNSWLKLSNENLIYGFTLENTSKLSLPSLNLILLKDNKQMWSRFHYECWVIEKNKNAFDFHSGLHNNFKSNNIKKNCLRINSESSVVVASVIEDWSCVSVPYSFGGIVYINDENYDRIQYINADKIMVTSDLFLKKEFGIFMNNSILVEDIIILYSTKLLSSYQIKCSISLKDLKIILEKDLKFEKNNDEWFVHSLLSWLRTIICYLDPISPFEYILHVFSNSLVYTKMFIQVLSSMLPEQTSIKNLDNDGSKCSNIGVVTSDLKELRRVFKECLEEQIIVPRTQWSSTRLKLVTL